MVILLSNLHPLNENSPISLTLSGIAMLLSDSQPSKALSPMFITVLGIVTFMSDVHLQNAPCSISTTPSGTVYAPVLPLGHKISLVLSLLNRTPSSDEYFGLLLLTFMLVSDVQLENAHSPMLVTLFPIVTF